MSNRGHIWRFSFVVQSVDGLHSAAHAFFRTSEYGVWQPDGEKSSDAFVLHYQRGSWKPPPSKLNFFFNGVGAYENFVAGSGWDGWKIAPMMLTVAFRPIPAQGAVKILLEYQLGGPNPSLLYEAAASRLAHCVSQETKLLANYLRENLALQGLPEILHDSTA